MKKTNATFALVLGIALAGCSPDKPQSTPTVDLEKPSKPTISKPDSSKTPVPKSTLPKPPAPKPAPAPEPGGVVVSPPVAPGVKLSSDPQQAYLDAKARESTNPSQPKVLAPKQD